MTILFIWRQHLRNEIVNLCLAALRYLLIS